MRRAALTEHTNPCSREQFLTSLLTSNTQTSVTADQEWKD